MTYAYDTFRGISPEPDNQKAALEGGSLGFHNTNLHDQDEDAAGNLIDEATGERIDNSTATDLGALTVREIRRTSRSQDILGDLPKLKDDKLADKWFREHDPDWSEKS